MDEVSRYMSGLPGSEQLTLPPKQFRDSFEYCWRIPLQVDGNDFRLLVLLDHSFPYSHPRVAIENGPSLLEWPHLENLGLLCLLPSGSTVDWQKPVAVVGHVLSMACELIERNLNGDLQLEFQEEFLSYWSYACDKSNSSAISLVEPRGPTRKISCLSHNGKDYFGESPEELGNWYANRFREKAKKLISETWLVWLKEPLVPAQYPRNPKDLLRLMEPSISDVDECVIANMVTNGYLLLIGAPTSNGSCFAAARHIPPRKRRQQGPKRTKSDPVINGYRKGKVDNKTAILRATGAGSKIEKIRVDRADHWWIHGRDQDERAQELGSRSVCIVGLGSLGSEVAMLLARSGVGRLELIDGQVLDWPNISRHALGASSVRYNKSDALKRSISEQLPHLTVISNPVNISRKSTKEIETAFNTDLLLLLTGDWVANAIVNERWLQAKRPVPLMLAWMEPQALVTHCVALSQTNTASCLNCGFDGKGRPYSQVFNYTDKSFLNVPACGGQFSPYGAVPLAKSAAFVSEKALAVLGGDSIGEYSLLVGSDQQKQRAKAKWSSYWGARDIKLSSGAITLDSQWGKRMDCPCCGGG